jgi:hypothetical protein
MFYISQHSRDKALLESFITYFDCGNCQERSDKLFVDFIVTKFSDIHDKIIPFFKENPILGVKALDFNDFSEAAEITKKKEHLTEEGLNKIRAIKARMNKGRDIFANPSASLTTNGNRMMSTKSKI